MAIAFDNATFGSTVSTSLTFSHTVAGSNRILFVGLINGTDYNTDIVTGVTYNGVSMTLVGKATSGNTNTVPTYLYYLIAPATGANNVVVSWGGATKDFRATASSYTGAKQSGQPDASTTGNVNGGSSITTSVTTVANNCWCVSYCGSNLAAPVNSTGINALRGGSHDGGFGDSNGVITPAGSYSMTWTTTGGDQILAVQASLAPAAAAVNSNFLAFF